MFFFENRLMASCSKQTDDVNISRPYFSHCFLVSVDSHKQSIDSKILNSENRLVDVFYITDMRLAESYSYNVGDMHKRW